MTWPKPPTGSICLSPPYRLPMPAAMMTKTGFFMGSTSFWGLRPGQMVNWMAQKAP